MVKQTFVTKDGILVKCEHLWVEDIERYPVNWPEKPTVNLKGNGDIFYKALIISYENEYNYDYDGKQMVLMWQDDSIQSKRIKNENNDLVLMMNRLKPYYENIAEIICEDYFTEIEIVNKMLSDKISKIDFDVIAEEWSW